MAETLKSKRRAGDALVGLGAVFALIGLVFAFMTANTGGNLMVAALFFGGLLTVAIGYLQRIAAALEAR